MMRTKEEQRAESDALVAAFLAKGNQVRKPSPEDGARAAKARKDLDKEERHAHCDGASYARHQNEAWGTPGSDHRDAREHDLHGKPGHSLLAPKG
jgi:hypothetical protein